MKWSLIHQESPKGTINLEAWQSDGPKHIIFLRHADGLSVRAYSCMEDAVEDNSDFALADVCYGWYTLIWERDGEREDAHCAFLDDCRERSESFTDVSDQFVCHSNPGGCEEAFHIGQVILGNEVCDGCDICIEYAAQVKS